ncbi:tetratricopeptide repeat protein [Candidatus Palauibacter sp.]|uniref:tetratricopeptide repeat protein n=1 Tax=Candidatus Palauibacter sp. TaxID=3101350 RepID=UPI003B5C56A7
MAADDQTVEIEQLTRRGESEPRTHTFARLADLYRQAGERERALSVIRDGLREHPYYLDARLLHARVLLELGDEEAARIEFEHILTLDPANPLACIALGVERVETKADGSSGAAASTDDWLEALEETWRNDEADARPAPKGDATGPAAVPTKGIETSTLAGLYASQGLFDRAIAVYEQMLSRNPDDAELIAAIAELRRRAEDAREPREVQPAPEAPDTDVPESIGEQLRRILDGEASAGSD